MGMLQCCLSTLRLSCGGQAGSLALPTAIVRVALLLCRVMVSGPGPSARYAHTLALVANRFLVAMGGNDGKATLSDAWALDTSDKPYQWRLIEDAGETPGARCGPQNLVLHHWPPV